MTSETDHLKALIQKKMRRLQILREKEQDVSEYVNECVGERYAEWQQLIAQKPELKQSVSPNTCTHRQKRSR